MSTSKKTDRAIESFLANGLDQLPDHVYDEVRGHIDHTRQRVVLGPWKEEQVSRFAKVALAAAAIVLIAVVGIQFLPLNGAIGSPPTSAPTPTASPTAMPTAPGATPVADPQSRLTAGTYVAHPFGPPNQAMGITFTVPSDSWEALADPGHTTGIAWAGDSAGVGMGFVRATSLNGDPCHWSGAADDVDVGTTVEALVTALTSADDFTASEPSNVTLGGFSGQKLVLTMPSTLTAGGNTQAGCDEQQYSIFNGEGFTIYAQGPENLWTLWILDVAGERLVIQRSEFANSPAERRQQLDSIVDSIVITAP
ncbi:MAG: hypothetical protein ABI725_03370 [Chloroflexota bacterium]